MQHVNFEPAYHLDQYEPVNETHTRYKLTAQRPGKGPKRYYLGSLVMTDIEAHRLAYELGAVLNLQEQNLHKFEAVNKAFQNIGLNESTLPNEALDRSA